jgi:arabinogalactan oligomer/maltooligosaccharide transport system permease protein
MSVQQPSARAFEDIPFNPPVKGSRFRVFARHATLWVLIFVILVPVWFIIASAGSGENAVISSLTPEKWSLANFSALYDDPDNVQFNAWVKNTIIIGGVSSALNVLIGGFGAYAFSRLRFRGRRATLMTLLMIQVFPSFLALSAVYAIMLRITDYAPSIGLGTPWGLILIYTGGALGINAWLIKGFFDTLPKELDESAMIDGASHAQIFFRIILPLALPALAVVFMLSFIGSLNDFILASVILGTDPNNQTLAVGLYGFITSGFDSKWGPFAAGSVLASVPVVIIFMSLQKYIVSGLTAGSVKG